MTTIRDEIQETLDANDVVLFMKGTRDVPQCGFSSRVAGVLNYMGVAYRDVNVLSSDEMRAELADVVTRPQFKLDEAARIALLARYDGIVTRVPVAPDCRLPCRDPDDRKFLDLAISRRTTWLLSRDRALLAARKVAWNRFEVRIGQVADFYQWLDIDSHGTPP